VVGVVFLEREPEALAWIGSSWPGHLVCELRVLDLAMGVRLVILIGESLLGPYKIKLVVSAAAAELVQWLIDVPTFWFAMHAGRGLIVCASLSLGLLKGRVGPLGELPLL